MKISEITKRIIKNAKEITKTAKEKYQENIEPKVNELIDDAIEYVTENYPKAKDEIKEIYAKTKSKTERVIQDVNTFRQFALSKPPTNELKKEAIKAKSKYIRQSIKVEYLQKQESQNSLKIQSEINLRNKLKQEFELAEKKYQEFIEKQKAVQKEFERLNQSNK